MKYLQTPRLSTPTCMEQSKSILTNRRNGDNVKVEKYGWKLMSLVMLMLVVSAEAQTFQYSRGWTNGKRSGGGGNGVGGGGVYGGPSSVLGPYDLEANGLLSTDPLEVILPPGHLQMSLNPALRLRPGDYYSQYLVKRSATPGNARKPLWFGALVGEDGSGSGPSSVAAPPPPNANPGGPNPRTPDF